MRRSALVIVRLPLFAKRTRLLAGRGNLFTGEPGAFCMVAPKRPVPAAVVSSNCYWLRGLDGVTMVAGAQTTASVAGAHCYLLLLAQAGRGQQNNPLAPNVGIDGGPRLAAIGRQEKDPFVFRPGVSLPDMRECMHIKAS